MYAIHSIVVEDIVAGPRQGVRTKIKLADRTAALRLLGQHHQLFSERVEHQHQHHVLIEHAARELDDRLALLTARRAEEPKKAGAEGAEIVEVEVRAT
jgi:hypothetical protein